MQIKSISKNGGLLLGVICIITLVLVCGCERRPIRTENVEGTVTFQGKPLAGAAMGFSPTGTGNPAYGSTDENGKYVIQTFLGAPNAGTTPGKYAVTISKIEMVPTGRTFVSEDGATVEMTSERQLIPSIFLTSQTTPIIVTVERGKNVIDIDLDKYLP